MQVLKQLDAVTTELAGVLHRSAPLETWARTRLAAMYAPDGTVGGHDYDYHLADGSVNRSVSPPAADRQLIRSLTERHWRLTQDLGQPRWYKMIVTVERNGKFKVDFEYKDDYKEGDIMQRG